MNTAEFTCSQKLILLLIETPNEVYIYRNAWSEGHHSVDILYSKDSGSFCNSYALCSKFNSGILETI